MPDERTNPLPDPSELAAHWPAPDPDEPASLRQDILDELSDHLQSAYDHELIKASDNQTAAARVLDRFGDPAAIARQLWWDAMKGPAMRQTLLIVVSAVSTTLSVAALGGLAWFAAAWQTANTRLAELQRELAQNAVQQQADREALRKELSAQFAARGEASANFLPLKLRVVRETSRQPVSFPLDFETRPTLPAPRQMITTDDGGRIYDFGLVPPGNYSISIEASAAGPWSGQQVFWVRPGNPDVLELAYPDQETSDPGRLRIDLGVPDDLRDAPLDSLRLGILLGGISHNGTNSWWNQQMRLPKMPIPEPGQSPFDRLVIVVNGLGEVVETVGCTQSSRNGESDSTWNCTVRQPGVDGTALLVGGRYSPGNWMWVLPPNFAEQTRFMPVEILMSEQAVAATSPLVSSATEARLSLTEPARGRLWDWVRWSGVLPATETITLPQTAVDVNVALFQGDAPTIALPSSEANPLKSLEKVDAVWLSLVIPKDFVEIFNAETQFPGELSEGLISVGQLELVEVDLTRQTLSLRVTSQQKQLLETYLNRAGSKLPAFELSFARPNPRLWAGSLPDGACSLQARIAATLNSRKPVEAK